MNRKIKFLALFLSLMMLLSVAVGCNNNQQQNDQTSDESDSQEEVTDRLVDDQTPDDEISNLPNNLDFTTDSGSPDTFTMLIRSNRRGAIEEFYVDISDGAQLTEVERAVYERNLYIEEELGIVFEYTYVKEGEIVSTIRTNASAQTSEFDVACASAEHSSTLISEKLLYDWNALDYVELDKVWWGSRSGMAEELTINGSLYTISGDASNLAVGKALCMYFNKPLLESYNVISADELYDLVLDNKWTVEYLTQMTSNMFVDKNGNQEADGGDTFGCNIYLATIVDNYFAAFDIPLVTRTESGKYVIDLNTERMLNGINSLNKLLYNAKNNTWLTTDKATSENFFKEGHCVFTHGGFEWAVDFLDMEEDYGIIPYPMLNEDQDGYSTTLSAVYTMFCVPANVKNPEKVGAVMEMLAVESYYTTTVAYFDVLLQGRAARDEQSYQILDLIHDTICYNIGFVYSGAIANNSVNPSYVLRTMLASSRANGEWSSWWATNGAAFQANLDKLLNQ